MPDAGAMAHLRGIGRTSGVATLVLGLATSGCALGFGIVDVGTTRTSTTQVSTVTYNGSSQLGNTTTSSYTVSNIRDVAQTTAGPHFGTMAGVHGGANVGSVDGHSGSGWVAETFLEMLGGRGRWALGLRAGIMLRKSDEIDVDGDGRTDFGTSYGGIPMTIHAYYGLSPTLSTHVGVGGDVYAFDDNPRSLRLMTGLRMALTSSDDGATLLVLDVDHLRSTRDAGDYRSVGLIAGLAFIR